MGIPGKSYRVLQDCRDKMGVLAGVWELERFYRFFSITLIVWGDSHRDLEVTGRFYTWFYRECEGSKEDLGFTVRFYSFF